MATAQLKWTLPTEDSNAAGVDVLDAGTVIGTVTPDVQSFTTAELTPGDHAFTVIVRSKAGTEFDSDPSNTATVTVPVAPVKLTAVSDLSATLQ